MYSQPNQEAARGRGMASHVICILLPLPAVTRKKKQKLLRMYTARRGYDIVHKAQDSPLNQKPPNGRLPPHSTPYSPQNGTWDSYAR